MNDLNYQLYDVVELRKRHPCARRSKLFQIVRVGADIKVKCQGCGNVIMFTRDAFNRIIKRVISHQEGILPID